MAEIEGWICTILFCSIWHWNQEFWSAVLCTDHTLKYDVSYSKVNVQGKQHLLEFMDHCCQCRHYSIDILKCGSSVCTICKPPRLSKEVFSKLHHLPDPIIGDDQHYVPFEKVFGTDITEKDRPSAQKSKYGGRKFTLKHVKNANIMLMCDECSLWRLLYSCNKLTDEEWQKVQDLLCSVSFTCGGQIEDFDADSPVYTWSLNYRETILQCRLWTHLFPLCLSRQVGYEK